MTDMNELREKIKKLSKQQQDWIVEIAQAHMRLGRKPSESFEKAYEEIAYAHDD